VSFVKNLGRSKILPVSVLYRQAQTSVGRELKKFPDSQAETGGETMFTGTVIDELIAAVRRAEDTARTHEELVRVPRFQPVPTYLFDLRHADSTMVWVA
jgi:hypothetical protein